MRPVAVDVVAAVARHWHVAARLSDQLRVDVERGEAGRVAQVGDALAPRVKGDRVPPRAAFVAVRVVLPDLRRGHDVALRLDGAAAKERLPVRLARLHGEGRGHEQHLRAVQEGELLVQLREAQVVADADAQPPGGAVCGDERVAGDRLPRLDQANKRRVVEVDLAVLCDEAPFPVDDAVGVVDALVAVGAALLKAAEREPEASLSREVEVTPHGRPVERLGDGLRLAWPRAHEGEVLGQKHDCTAAVPSLADVCSTGRKIGSHVVHGGHLHNRSFAAL
mmetsp:Transcript_49721/g.160576  ORF Transcript_49721/g.160576 Transcript_49721/m.160576 type:complete len:279 (+) Transcript_49721:1762-2598(+)